MKLKDRHVEIVRRAKMNGQYRAMSKETLLACFELCGARVLIERDDDASNIRVFELTPAGERMAEEIASGPKFPKIYVFAA